MKRRDPRIDPQVGDELVQTRHCIDRVRTFRRTVLNLPQEFVVYSVGTGRCNCVRLREWRKWARGAKVEGKA